MPAKSESQRRFMGAVRSYKEGRGKGSEEVREAARTMSMKEVRDMTHKPKRKPDRSKRQMGKSKRRSRRA